MNQQAVAQVLAEMSAMWPQREMSPPEVQLWVTEFLPLRAEATMTAVRELRKVCDWLPTHNQFLASYQAVTRRMALEQASIPESTSGVSSKETALAGIAEARFKLSTANRRKPDGPTD